MPTELKVIVYHHARNHPTLQMQRPGNRPLSVCTASCLILISYLAASWCCCCWLSSLSVLLSVDQNLYYCCWYGLDGPENNLSVMMCQPLQENLLSNSAAWKQVVAGMYRPTLELVTYDMRQYYGLCCWLLLCLYSFQWILPCWFWKPYPTTTLYLKNTNMINGPIDGPHLDDSDENMLDINCLDNASIRRRLIISNQKL